jgi:hypothetical protein
MKNANKWDSDPCEYHSKESELHSLIQKIELEHPKKPGHGELFGEELWFRATGYRNG